MIMRGVAVCVRNIIGDFSEGRRGESAVRVYRNQRTRTTLELASVTFEADQVGIVNTSKIVTRWGWGTMLSESILHCINYNHLQAVKPSKHNERLQIPEL